LRSTGRVGIGTTSPATTLHVQGNISASQITASVRASDIVGTVSNATTATNATSASYSLTASFVKNALTASVATLAYSADSATDAGTLNGYSPSDFFNASNLDSGTVNSSRLSGLYNISASYAKTASILDTQYVKQVWSGTNTGVGGTLSEPTVYLSDNISLTSVTASLFGTSSWANNAVNATTAAFASNANDSALWDGYDWIDWLTYRAPSVNGIILLTNKATYITGANATSTTYQTLLTNIRSGTSATIGANTLSDGKILEIECNGKMRGSDGYQPKLRLKIGSSYTREITIGENESNSHPAEGVPWNAFFSLLIDTAGASPTTSSMGYIDVQNTPDGGSWYSIRSMPAESGTVDTTTDNTITLEYYGHANMTFFHCNTVKVRII
jgi:hypothetical protein